MLNLKLTDEIRDYANRQVSIKNFGVRSEIGRAHV